MRHAQEIIVFEHMMQETYMALPAKLRLRYSSIKAAKERTAKAKAIKDLEARIKPRQ